METINKPVNFNIKNLSEIDYTFIATDGHKYRVNYTLNNDGFWNSTVYVEYQHGVSFNMCDKIGPMLTYKHPDFRPTKKHAIDRLKF